LLGVLETKEEAEKFKNALDAKHLSYLVKIAPVE